MNATACDCAVETHALVTIGGREFFRCGACGALSPRYQRGARLLDAITAEGCRLDMGQWHACETTHCRAGWVVTLAGQEGKALEAEVGTGRAAALIYRASDPGCRVPHWFANDEKAMEDIRACAEREASKGTP